MMCSSVSRPANDLSLWLTHPQGSATANPDQIIVITNARSDGKRRGELVSGYVKDDAADGDA
jgi:hypothetical protein